LPRQQRRKEAENTVRHHAWHWPDTCSHVRRMKSFCLRAPCRIIVYCCLAVSFDAIALARPDEALIMRASVPAGMDPKLKLALSEAISLHVKALGLVPKLRTYSIVPALLELREVIAPNGQQPGLACVVEMSLQDSARGVVANVRGAASSVGATQLETVDAAAQAAVNRLTETLKKLKEQDRRRAP
jgi:hypothetical protein